MIRFAPQTVERVAPVKVVVEARPMASPEISTVEEGSAGSAMLLTDLPEVMISAPAKAAKTRTAKKPKATAEAADIQLDLSA